MRCSLNLIMQIIKDETGYEEMTFPSGTPGSDGAASLRESFTVDLFGIPLFS